LGALAQGFTCLFGDVRQVSRRVVMAKRLLVHVEVHQNGWTVIRESNERATSVHPTQAEAAKEGRDIARRDEIEFFLHAQDGRIREHDSYGEGGTAQKGGDMSES